ncbi:MAG: cysteine hydrolase [Propionibacteriaceae bacterium]|nr:cysteine hydrolase [Propionibacteriaceae bacterium]
MTGTLVVIDMQRVFGDPGSPWATPRFDAIIDPIQQLIEAHGEAVVFTHYVSPAQPHGAWVDYFHDWPFALQPPSAELWRIVAPLEAAAARQQDLGVGPVVAETFSKWGPELAQLVGADGRMVLVGVSTDCCVLSTALAAADSGVEVLVVADATAGVEDATHAQALDLMRLYGPLIKVVTTAEAVAAARA